MSTSARSTTRKNAHTVTPTPMRPFVGAKTKSDKAPMSTPKYSSHMRKYAKSK